MTTNRLNMCSNQGSGYLETTGKLFYRRSNSKDCDRGHGMVGGGASEGWCLRLEEGCAKDSTHTRIIDRLEPSGKDGDG